MQFKTQARVLLLLQIFTTRISTVIFVNNHLDAQFFLYLFIPILYMFRATKCSSSEESFVSMRLLVYVTLCRWPRGMQVPSKPACHTVTYTRDRIDTTDSPDDERLAPSKHVEKWNKQI